MKKKNVSVPVSSTGTIVNIIQRRNGRKLKRYGFVEYCWNGFRYTQGFFLPDSPSYDTGKQIPVLLDPDDPRKARIDGILQTEISPLRSAAQWLMIIGIAILLCLLL